MQPLYSHILYVTYTDDFYMTVISVFTDKHQFKCVGIYSQLNALLNYVLLVFSNQFLSHYWKISSHYCIHYKFKCNRLSYCTCYEYEITQIDLHTWPSGAPININVLLYINQHQQPFYTNKFFRKRVSALFIFNP